MASNLVALCFDANDAAGLAHFWAEALGWELGPEYDGAFGVLPTDGTRFQIDFCPVPEEKVGQNLIHLDLTTTSDDDQREMVERLLALGAHHVDIGQTPDEGHVVLADPEGNELCIIEPGNRFLAGRGRLGSITCAGSPEVGHFWAEALGWDLFLDDVEAGETAIRMPDGEGPYITWGTIPQKVRKNRLHLDIAPPADEDQQAEVDRLIGLGARRIDIGQGDVSWVVMADPDGDEFCVLTPR